MCKESWCVGLRAGEELSVCEWGELCQIYLKKSGIEKRGFKNLKRGEKGEAGSRQGQGVGAYIYILRRKSLKPGLNSITLGQSYNWKLLWSNGFQGYCFGPLI